MTKITNLNEILSDWAYRVDGGMPDATKLSHLVILEKTLIECGWNVAERYEFIKNLQEDHIVKNKDSGAVYTVKNFNKNKHIMVKKNASDADIAKVKAKGKDGEDDKDTSTSTGTGRLAFKNVDATYAGPIMITIAEAASNDGNSNKEEVVIKFFKAKEETIESD